MSITLRHNEDLEINRVEYAGAVTAAELRAYTTFTMSHPEWLSFDYLSFILPGTVSDHTTADLDAMIAAYPETLFKPDDLLIKRRSCWVCHSPASQPMLAYWLNMRGAHWNLWSDVRQFDTLEAAGEWLLLAPAGVEALRTGDGFQEIARFGA